MKLTKEINVLIAWPEITDYAARSIREFINNCDNRYNVKVVATKPIVPIQGMDEILHGNLIWWDDIVDKKNKISSYSFGSIDIAFFGGYKTRWIKEIRLCLKRQNPKFKSILMSDNCHLSSFIKSVAFPFYFKLFYRRLYDGILVPGVEGERLAKKIGFDEHEIKKGLYSADYEVFKYDLSSRKKEKTILFVGQFIKRKNIQYLIDEFKESSLSSNGWSLRIIGAGSIKYFDEKSFNISISDFLQPLELAKEYEKAKVFALLSKEENWGLVVHEASLSGCYLILSDKVGSRSDLLTDLNGMTQNLNSNDSLRDKFNLIGSMNEEQFKVASSISQEQASKFSKAIFADALEYFVSQVESKRDI